MRQRLVLVLIFAVVIAAAASAILYRLISSQLSSNKSSAVTRVVVANRNLAEGDLIKDGDVKLGDWSGPQPPGALVKPEEAVNRGVVQSIYSGEAIVETRLAARGAGAGLAATIPPGMRAVAVRVNDVVGLSGFATPGTHVDILIAGVPPSGSSSGTVTKTLLQNIEILSAGQNIQRDSEGKPVSVAVVNLLVTPEQAEILSLASNDARIQFVLRNPTDKAEVQTPGTALANLFGVPPEGPKKPEPVKQVVARKAPAPVPVAVAPPPPPPPIMVEVITGTKKTSTTFKNEEANSSLEDKGK